MAEWEPLMHCDGQEFGFVDPGVLVNAVQHFVKRLSLAIPNTVNDGTKPGESKTNKSPG